MSITTSNPYRSPPGPRGFIRPSVSRQGIKQQSEIEVCRGEVFRYFRISGTNFARLLVVTLGYGALEIVGLLLLLFCAVIIINPWN